MSPERICGESYAFDSDVWSLGVSLLECATGRFPYPPEEEMENILDGDGDGSSQEMAKDCSAKEKEIDASAEEKKKHASSWKEKEETDTRKPPVSLGFWDLLDHIVREPAPALPRNGNGNGPGNQTWTSAFRFFLESCLRKTPSERASAATLLTGEWLSGSAGSNPGGGELGVITQEEKALLAMAVGKAVGLLLG